MKKFKFTFGKKTRLITKEEQLELVKQYDGLVHIIPAIKRSLDLDKFSLNDCCFKPCTTSNRGRQRMLLTKRSHGSYKNHLYEGSPVEKDHTSRSR